MKCNIYPIFTEEELAKLMWFKGDELSKYIAKRVSKDGFLVLPKSYVDKDKLSVKDVSKGPCVFYKGGKCTIEDYKPIFCKINIPVSNEDRLAGYLELTDEFKLSNLNKIREIEDYSNPKVIKKHNKHLKEDLIYFFMLGYLDQLLGDPDDIEDKKKVADGLYVESKYYLYKYRGDKRKGYTIRPLRLKYLTTDKKEYKDIVNYINRISKRFYYYPQGYIKFLERKMNQLLKGISFKPNGINPKDPEDVFFLISIMTNLYKRNFINKNKWKGFVNDDVIYNYMKYYIEKRTGEEYSFKSLSHPEIENKVKNVEMVYNSIIKNK